MHHALSKRGKEKDKNCGVHTSSLPDLILCSHSTNPIDSFAFLHFTLTHVYLPSWMPRESYRGPGHRVSSFFS